MHFSFFLPPSASSSVRRRHSVSNATAWNV